MQLVRDTRATISHRHAGNAGCVALLFCICEFVGVARASDPYLQELRLPSFHHRLPSDIEPIRKNSPSPDAPCLPRSTSEIQLRLRMPASKGKAPSFPVTHPEPARRRLSPRIYQHTATQPEIGYKPGGLYFAAYHHNIDTFCIEGLDKRFRRGFHPRRIRL